MSAVALTRSIDSDRGSAVNSTFNQNINVAGRKNWRDL
jgi:hypothetical protein